MGQISLSADFLCNSLDDPPLNLLHKNSNDQFLCNKTGDDTPSPLHKIFDQVDTLPISDLKQLLQYIQSKLNEGLEIPVGQNREIIETRRVGAFVYQLEKVRCGKKCRKCPHGPYWYVYYRSDGKIVSRYIGKRSPLI